MKKVCALFLSIFTLPAVASGINANTNSAPCTNNTLETYSGNTNLQADWQPNTINLRWYNGNTLMNVQSAANTCVYDGALTIPSTAPSRTGYTFAGWQVKPEMDFATTIPNTTGIEGWALVDSYCSHYYFDPGEQLNYYSKCDDNSADLGQREWKLKFSHGNLYGMSVCSATAGTYAQPGNPTIESGQYCWCKATGYKPVSDDIIFGSLYTLDWVYVTNKTSESSCLIDCPIRCSINAFHRLDFRSALLHPQTINN